MEELRKVKFSEVVWVRWGRGWGENGAMSHACRDYPTPPPPPTRYYTPFASPSFLPSSRLSPRCDLLPLPDPGSFCHAQEPCIMGTVWAPHHLTQPLNNPSNSQLSIQEYHSFNIPKFKSPKEPQRSLSTRTPHYNTFTCISSLWNIQLKIAISLSLQCRWYKYIGSLRLMSCFNH